MFAVDRNRANLCLVAAALVALVLATPARAQPILHRNAAPAGVTSPTGGTFSIRFPVAFNDMETKVPDPERGTVSVRLLTGAGGDKIRFSAMETPMQATASPIGGFVDEVKQRPGAAVSDVHQERNGDIETLTFSYRDPRESSFFRVSRTKQNGYTLVVQFPEAQRDKAAAMKDQFFGSFKIVKR